MSYFENLFDYNRKNSTDFEIYNYYVNKRNRLIIRYRHFFLIKTEKPLLDSQIKYINDIKEKIDDLNDFIYIMEKLTRYFSYNCAPRYIFNILSELDNLNDLDIL